MLGELHDLSFGPVSPIVAVIFTTLSSLLGIIVAAQARACTGRRRLRLVACAAVAVAAAGVWLPALIAVLGLRVDGSVVRVDLAGLGLSLGAAILAAACALLLLCFGRVRPERLLAGALLLGAGVTGSSMLMLRSVATGGVIAADGPLTVAALAMGLVAAAMLALLLGAAPSLRWAVGMSLPLGIALAAIHVVSAAALTLRPSPRGTIPADEVPGLDPMQVGLPTIVLSGVLLAIMWYFSMGTATVRDLRLIFQPASPGDLIEPWMIEQVRARVAMSSTALAPAPSWGDGVWIERTVAVRSIPLLGGAVASAFARGQRDLLGEPLLDDEPPVDPFIPDELPEPPTVDSPVWRPVPGWDVPDASRSMLTHPPAPAGRPTQPGSRWDQRDWSQRDVGERNEQHAGARARATNSRQSQFPSRGPARSQAPAYVDGGRAFVPVVRESSEPLPRRNARP